jgi:hypothetical protein
VTAPTGTGPTTVPRILAMLSLQESEADAVAGPVAAVNSLVRGWLKPAAVVDGEELWDARHVYGADLLAARLYRRRDSPAGVLPFGQEGAAYVQRNDPDVALLLEMGHYARLQVG